MKLKDTLRSMSARQYLTAGLGGAAMVGSGSNAFSYGGSSVLIPTSLRAIGIPTSLSDYRRSHFNTSIVLGNKSEAGAVGPARKLSTAFGNNKQLQNNGLNQAPPD